MFSQDKEDVKLEWMYKGPNANVDREDYLLGRSVDKTLEQLNEEEKQKKLGVVQPKNHVEHECIPPSIRDYKKQQLLAEQVDIQNKLQEDPLIAIKKKEEESRRQFLNNPVQLKRLQEALEAQRKMKKTKKKKHKKSKYSSDSENDIDAKLNKKLQLLKKFQTKGSLNAKMLNQETTKPRKDEVLDTILMHKFNAFKSKLSDEDLQDILAGKITDTESDSDNSNSRHENQKKSKKNEKQKKKNKNEKNDDSDSDTEREKTKNQTKSSHRKHRNYSSDSSSEERESCQRKRTGGKEKNEKFKSRSQHQERSRSRDRSKHDSRRSYGDNRSFNKRENRRRDSSGTHTYDRQKNDHKKSRKDSESSLDRKKSTKSNSYDKKKESDRNEEVKYNSYKQNHQKSKTSINSDSDSDNHSKKQNYGLVTADGKKLPFSKDHSKTKTSPTKQPVPLGKSRKDEKSKHKEISREEREQKIKEMMANAAWRDKERSQTVKAFREKESNEEKQQKEYNPDFLHKELLKSANSASVESRIKSNVNNIQRSKNDMSSNFSKR